MKWRPISELSDEQRDGRWWGFSDAQSEKINLSCGLSINTCYSITWLRFCPSSDGYKQAWLCEDMSAWCEDLIPEKKYFLSEPLPEFPKPQKMEWRKFNEVSPCQDQLILVSENVGSRPFVVTFCDGLTNYKTHWYWMPIVPPEGE